MLLSWPRGHVGYVPKFQIISFVCSKNASVHSSVQLVTRGFLSNSGVPGRGAGAKRGQRGQRGKYQKTSCGMDDVEAAIQALEWGKKELATTAGAYAEKARYTSSSGVAHGLAAAKLSAEVQHMRAEMARAQTELEASQRRCQELELDRSLQRQDRDSIEKDLLSSRTMQTEAHAQLHGEIRSLQQQLWQARQDVEHWRAKDTQSQAQLASAAATADALRSRLASAEREHKSVLSEVRQKLDEALAERDAAALEARQMRMGVKDDGKGSETGMGSDAGSFGEGLTKGSDSLPHQVAKRLRQAAKANEELRARLDSAEMHASRTEILAGELAATKQALDQREGQLQAFESALKLTLTATGGPRYPQPPLASSPQRRQQQQQQQQQQQHNTSTPHERLTASAVSISAAMPTRSERSRPVSAATSPFSSPRGSSATTDQSTVVGLARRAENVATNASDMLHLLTSKHADLLQHVRSLTSRLEQAQGRLVEMEGAHRGEVEAMEAAHHKILVRLRDIGVETSSLNEAVRRKTHLAVEKAVHEMAETLSREKKLRAKAETSMKEYRARVEEWEVALRDADERARRAGRRAEKTSAKIERLKETLQRAKTRIAKLEADRSNLRDVVRTNRWREAQLAEQAATQAEIQVRHLLVILFLLLPVNTLPVQLQLTDPPSFISLDSGF